MNQIRQGQIYRHFKGNRYRIIAVAKHSETEEDYVVYQALYGDFGIWVRPMSLFLSYKEHQGEQIPRFQLEVESPSEE